MLRPRVIVLLAFSASVLSLAAYFSNATFLVNGLTSAEMGRSQIGSASAWSGTSSLVAWPDYRRTNSAPQSDIYAARIDATNAVEDRQGLAVSTASGLQDAPSMAFGSGVWLVAWSDTRAGAGNIDVYAARVSLAGVVLDPGGIAIANTGAAEQLPSVGYDGTRFLVAYQRTTDDGGFSVEGSLVLPDGTAGSSFVLSTGAGNETTPSTACTTNQCLVSWQDTRNDVADIFATRVTGTMPLDEPNFVVGSVMGAQTAPASAFDGSRYLVVWGDQPAAGTYTITAARVQTDGIVTDPSGVVVTSSTAIKARPAVGCRSSDCLITWQEWLSGINLRGARFRQLTGAVLDAPPVTYTNNSRQQHGPSVSATSTQYIVSYFDNTWPSNDNTRSRVVNPFDGSTLPSFVTSLSRARQFNSGIGTNGVTTYVGWLERRDGLWATWARPFQPNGQPAAPAFALDPEPSFLIGTTFLAPTFAAAPDGTFLSVWARRSQALPNSSVFVRKLDAAGPLDDGGVTVSGPGVDARGPSAAWVGTQFLVVWDDNTATTREIRGARVSLTGVVQDPGGLRLVSSSVNQINPELACRTTGCLFIWADRRAAGTALMMALLDPASLTVSNIQELASQVDFQWFSVAGGNDGYLVAWTQGTSSYDVRAARIAADGTVLDPGGLRLAERADQDYDPSVGSDGTHFHVVWSHQVTGQGDETVGAKISWDGAVDVAFGYPLIDAGLDDRIEARVAVLGADSMLVSFTDLVEPSSFARQVGVRSVRFGDDAGAASDAGFDGGAELDAGFGADAGLELDAGLADSGVADSGALIDSGSAGDGGVADGGRAADGGAGNASVDGGPLNGQGARSYQVGCDCSVAGEGWLKALAVALIWRRRRASVHRLT